jgi:nitrogen regulation protein NR(I)
MTRILVIDDEEMICVAFAAFLKDEGYIPLLAGESESAMEQIKTLHPEIVFLDYRLPGRDGLDLLKEIRQVDPTIAIVFMTAFGAMDVAIKAMQSGAYEYLSKPLDLGKIQAIINRILEGKKSLALAGPNEMKQMNPVSMGQIIGKGPAMQDVFKMIGLLTTQDVTVLITGESGVGKELVARAIHGNSPRGNKPFVAVNCGAMPENLLEAEMFGYERGAFTGAENRKLGKFEVADGGTIFLDEIGEMQFSLQVKLLRVLQEKTFERIGGNTTIPTDARIIAATNKDLFKDVVSGKFRKDLFYRIDLINIHLPPLRERREDIPLLVDHFIQKGNVELGRTMRGLTEEALLRLTDYHWPGNVRELENQIKRAMVISREDILSEYAFELNAVHSPGLDESSKDQLDRATRDYFETILKGEEPYSSLFESVIGSVEKTLIQEALHRTNQNQAHAAQLLGLHRSTLRKKCKDYGM